MRAKLIATFLFVCSATMIVRLLIDFRHDRLAARLVAMVCALGFLFAAGSVFRRSRLSYFVATTAGLGALYWFARIELMNFPPINSWILFNLPDRDPNTSIAMLRVLYVTLLVTSTAYAMTRLSPANWTFRGSELNEQMWPSLAVCCVVITPWYSGSATPYRIPWIVDAVQPEIAILHVQKDGMQFHEESIFVYHDAKFDVERNDRRLFQYGFATDTVQGVISAGLKERALLLSQSPVIRGSRAVPAAPLRAWKSEGWYVRTSSGVLAFTTENGEKPPVEMTDFFHDVRSIVPSESRTYILNDVCLGFCYDPPAGLGLKYLNDRCKEKNGTRCK